MPCHAHTQISSFLHNLINWFLALALTSNNLLYVPLPLFSFKFHLLLKHFAWMSRKLQICCWCINTANLHHRNWHHNKVWNMPHTNSFQERKKPHKKAPTRSAKVSSFTRVKKCINTQKVFPFPLLNMLWCCCYGRIVCWMLWKFSFKVNWLFLLCTISWKRQCNNFKLKFEEN